MPVQIDPLNRDPQFNPAPNPPIRMGSSVYTWGNMQGGSADFSVFKQSSPTTWTAYDSGSYGEMAWVAADPSNHRLITVDPYHGFFQDFDTATNSWGSAYGSVGWPDKNAGYALHLLSNGDLLHLHWSYSYPNRLLWSLYSGGWVSVNNVVSSNFLGSAGSAVSSILDSSDRVHIFFTDSSTGYLYYVAWQGSSLGAIVTIDTSNSIYNSCTLGLQQSSNGYLRLPVVLHGLQIAFLTATNPAAPTWTQDVVYASSGSDGVYIPSAFQDGSGNLSMLWTKRINTPYTDRRQIYQSSQSGASWPAPTILYDESLDPPAGGANFLRNIWGSAVDGIVFEIQDMFWIPSLTPLTSLCYVDGVVPLDIGLYGY